MGSGQSAFVVVKLDQLTVVPGGLITGKVYLDVQADTIDCSSIDLTISGVESTCVQYSSGSGKNRRTNYARQQIEFLNATVTLAQMPRGQLTKGNYEFPFSFVVPQGVTSSMSLGGASNCSIRYEATGVVHNPQKTWLGGVEDKYLSATTPFAVFSGLTSIPYSPLYVDPKFVPMNCCFCFDQGSILLGMSCDSSVWVPGEVHRINYMVQNNSKAKIKAIKFELVESIQFHANSHSHRSNVEHMERRLEATAERNETKIELALLEKHENPITNTPDQLLGLKKHLDSGNVSLDVTLPAHARVSYQGSIIFVTHSIVMTVITTFGTSNIETVCPITVVNRLVPVVSEEPTIYPTSYNIMAEEISKEQVNVGLPAYWNPQQAPPVQLQFQYEAHAANQYSQVAPTTTGSTPEV